MSYFEYILILGISTIVDEGVELSFTNTLGIEEILHREKIKAHGAGLLHELLPLINKVLWNKSRGVGIRS